MLSTPHKNESPAATGLHATNTKNHSLSIPRAFPLINALALVPELDFQKLKAALAEHERVLKWVFNVSTEVVHFEVHHGGKKRWFRNLESVSEYHRTLGSIHAVK